MDAIISKLIANINSSVFVLLIILCVAFYLVYMAGKFKEKFVHHEKKLNNVEGFSEKIIELKTKVDLIYQNTNPNKLVAAHSPISLTPIGEVVSKKINADVILKSHLHTLIKEVEKEAPRNAYDIQMVSMNVAKEKILSLLNEGELNIIKDEAFAKGLLVEDIMSIFGVLLRNNVLQQKNIPIADVDKHAAQRNGET